jgi:hypothetical protein
VSNPVDEREKQELAERNGALRASYRRTAGGADKEEHRPRLADAAVGAARVGKRAGAGRLRLDVLPPLRAERVVDLVDRRDDLRDTGAATAAAGNARRVALAATASQHQRDIPHLLEMGTHPVWRKKRWVNRRHMSTALAPAAAALIAAAALAAGTSHPSGAKAAARASATSGPGAPVVSNFSLGGLEPVSVHFPDRRASIDLPSIGLKADSNEVAVEG